MELYRYKARTARGGAISGEIKAVDETDLRIQIHRMGLTLRSFKLYKERRRMSLWDILSMPMHWLEALFEVVLGGRRKPYDPKKFECGRKARSDIRARISNADTRTMPTFSYVAKTRGGNRIRGEMEAVDEAELRDRLLLLELELVDATKEAVVKELSGLVRPYRVPIKDLVILTGQLETYFNIDMRMSEIIDSARVGCDSKKFKRLLLGVRNYVAEGDTLTRALRRYPGAFSRFFVSSIEAGEESGKLSAAMMYAHRHLKWIYDFRRRCVAELRWPLFSFCFVGSALLLWIAAQAWITALLIVVMLVVAWKTGSRVAVLKHTRDRVLLALPIFGNAFKLYDTLNFTYLFGIMWSAGLTAEHAIRKGKQVVHNEVLRDALSNIGDRVRCGAKLSEAFAESELFDLQVVMAFNKGETTGNFETALDGVYYFYIRQLEDAMENVILASKLLLLIATGAMVLGLHSVIRLY